MAAPPGFRVPAPRLPPKVAPPPKAGVNYTPAVLLMVDSDTAPTIATVYLNGGGQPQTGFAIPSNLGVTFKEAPYPFVAPGPGIAYYENQTHLVGGANVLVDVDNRQLVSIQTGNSTTAPVDYTQLQFIRHNGGFAPAGWQQPPAIDNTQIKSIPATGTPSSATEPTLSSAALGATSDQGAAGWKQSVSAAWADWAVGSVPGWVAGSRFYTRTRGISWSKVAAGDQGVLQSTNAIAGTVTLPAGVICDIGISLFDLASGAETPIAWPTAWSNILAQTITTSTLDILAQLKLVEPDYVISGGDATSTGNGWDVGTWDATPWDF